MRDEKGRIFSTPRRCWSILAGTFGSLGWRTVESAIVHHWGHSLVTVHGLLPLPLFDSSVSRNRSLYSFSLFLPLTFLSFHLVLTAPYTFPSFLSFFHSFCSGKKTRRGFFFQVWSFWGLPRFFHSIATVIGKEVARGCRSINRELQSELRKSRDKFRSRPWFFLQFYSAMLSYSNVEVLYFFFSIFFLFALLDGVR